MKYFIFLRVNFSFYSFYKLKHFRKNYFFYIFLSCPYLSFFSLMSVLNHVLSTISIFSFRFSIFYIFQNDYFRFSLFLISRGNSCRVYDRSNRHFQVKQLNLFPDFSATNDPFLEYRIHFINA
jgi:hypothetical protein